MSAAGREGSSGEDAMVSGVARRVTMSELAWWLLVWRLLATWWLEVWWLLVDVELTVVAVAATECVRFGCGEWTLL